MAKKEYGHLVKPMLVRNAPDGLYDEPRVWMEAKDLEGFNAHFSFGFVTKPAVFHPVQGAVVHPYDEILVFGGFANGDIMQPGRGNFRRARRGAGEARLRQAFARPHPQGNAPRPGNREQGRYALRPLYHRACPRVQGILPSEGSKLQRARSTHTSSSPSGP